MTQGKPNETGSGSGAGGQENGSTAEPTGEAAIGREPAVPSNTDNYGNYSPSGEKNDSSSTNQGAREQVTDAASRAERPDLPKSPGGQDADIKTSIEQPRASSSTERRGDTLQANQQIVGQATDVASRAERPDLKSSSAGQPGDAAHHEVRLDQLNNKGEGPKDYLQAKAQIEPHAVSASERQDNIFKAIQKIIDEEGVAANPKERPDQKNNSASSAEWKMIREEAKEIRDSKTLGYDAKLNMLYDKGVISSDEYINARLRPYQPLLGLDPDKTPDGKAFDNAFLPKPPPLPAELVNKLMGMAGPDSNNGQNADAKVKTGQLQEHKDTAERDDNLLTNQRVSEPSFDVASRAERSDLASTSPTSLGDAGTSKRQLDALYDVGKQGDALLVNQMTFGQSADVASRVERADLSSKEREERLRIATPADGVGFQFGKSQLVPGMMEQWLASQPESLRKALSDPNAHVIITASASRPGSESYNKQLSSERADTVRQWFNDHGVRASIEINALGENPAKPDRIDDASDRVAKIEIRPATEATHDDHPHEAPQNMPEKDAQKIEALRNYLRQPENKITKEDPVSQHQLALARIWEQGLKLADGDPRGALYICREAVRSSAQKDAGEVAIEDKYKFPDKYKVYTDRLAGIPSKAFGEGSAKTFWGKSDTITGEDKPQHFFGTAEVAFDGAMATREYDPVTRQFSPPMTGPGELFGNIAGRGLEQLQALTRHPGGYSPGDIYADDFGAAFGAALASATSLKYPFEPIVVSRMDIRDYLPKNTEKGEH